MSPKLKGGSYYFDRRFPGIGRVQPKAWTASLATFRKRDRLLSTLYDAGELDVLRALKAGTRTIVEVEEAVRRKRLASLDTTGKTTAPLWATIERVLSQQAKEPVTLERPCRNVTVDTYRKSAKALRVSGVLPARATVAELLTLDWDAIEAAWGRSPTNWMHLRRMLSRVLTLHLGKEHPARREMLARIPRREEIPREPDVTPDVFWRVVLEMPRHIRAAPIAIAATGLRRSEFAQLEPADLMHETKGVRVRRKVKNRWSVRVIPVADAFWPWVVAAVPLPVSIGWVYERWTDACRAAGVERIRFHDLRHCFGQWATDAGVDEGAVQKMLGHKTRHQTAIYTARKVRRDASEAVAKRLNVPGVPAYVPANLEGGNRRGA